MEKVCGKKRIPIEEAEKNGNTIKHAIILIMLFVGGGGTQWASEMLLF